MQQTAIQKLYTNNAIDVWHMLLEDVQPPCWLKTCRKFHGASNILALHACLISQCHNFVLGLTAMLARISKISPQTLSLLLSVFELSVLKVGLEVRLAMVTCRGHMRRLGGHLLINSTATWTIKLLRMLRWLAANQRLRAKLLESLSFLFLNFWPLHNYMQASTEELWVILSSCYNYSNWFTPC